MTRSDDKLETVPITEQIEARVNDAVGELARDRRVEPAAGAPVEEPAPLELAMPVPREAPRPDPPTPFDGKRWLMRSLKWTALVVLVFAGAGAFLAFTDLGRSLLPQGMRGDAAKIAQDVEERARDATQDTFYTYTDDQGQLHIVDELEKVPQEFRARAKKTR